MGLHERYARILGDHPLTLGSPSDETRRKLTAAFHGMMSALYEQKGATLDINILASDEAQTFIETHAGVLDSSFSDTPMSERMRQRLRASDYVFSGMKTFHELNEAFPSLTDEDGHRKPFEQFLNDVRKVDETYNRNYLRAEYNFVHESAAMAGKWEEFAEDGDRYNLQYRTAGDDKVREEHAALDGVTLPFSDPFWETYYPPNGWNCRCTVVQVRKGKYPETPRNEAMEKGAQALSRDKKGMFAFNPGKEQKSVPDYNPYTIEKCKRCEVAQGKVKLAYAPDNEVCAACRLCRSIQNAKSEKDACAKAMKVEAKKKVQGKTLHNDDFNHQVLLSGKSVSEWTNQPHKHYYEKNRLLLDIEKVYSEAKYLGYKQDYKNRPNITWSHIFETMIAGEKSWIVVNEYTDGNCVLHSISDGENMTRNLIKQK